MRSRFGTPFLFLLLVLVLAPAMPALAQDAATAPFTEGLSDPASLKRTVDRRVAHAQALLDAMLAV